MENWFVMVCMQCMYSIDIDSDTSKKKKKPPQKKQSSSASKTHGRSHFLLFHQSGRPRTGPSPQPRSALLSPARPPSDIYPQHRARGKDHPGHERKAPPAAHAVDHLNDDARGAGSHQAPHQVVGGRGGGGALGVEIDEEHAEHVEGCRRGEPNDEEEHQRHGEGRFSFERPPESQDRGDPRV